MNITQLINQCEDYIENHLGERITLLMLSNHLGVSPYYFHRLFKYHTHETIHHFITRIKMERSAIYMISNKKIGITEIAYKYGYADASSYTKAFKRHFNMTPTTFKKARKDN